VAGRSLHGFGLKLLEWFCPPQLYEGIEGDLLEKFDVDSKSSGDRIARRRLLIGAVRFLRPAIIMRNRFRTNSPSTSMIGNYFKITYRNILRSKGYSFINIFGLALGIASCLLALSYVRFEMSYDNYHPNVDRIYRVDQTFIWSVEGGTFGSTPLPLALKLAAEYPEVEEVIRVNAPGAMSVRYEREDGTLLSFNEPNIYGADSGFFNFFDYKLKEGNPATALKGLNKIVISSEAAEKFFGDAPALGKFLLVGDDRKVLEVTGVTEPQPMNSHFRFDYLQSIYTNPSIKRFEWSWVWTQSVTYAKLRPGAVPSELEEKMARIEKDHIRPSFDRMGIVFDDFMKGKGNWRFYLRPMRDIHLHAEDNRIGTVGSIVYASTFGVVGIFVLVIAAINFINLSTARATNRAKEVGVKKTLGVLRSSLVSQFQAESIFLTLFATVLSLLMVEGLRLVIGKFVNIDMPFTLWSDTALLVTLPLVPLLVGFVAGIYPSFYLTAFKPVQVLKGKIASGMARSGLRNGLVVIQFTISIAMLAGTLVVLKQLKFMQSAELGFNRENVLVVRGAEKLGDQLESFRDEVAGFAGVEHTALAMNVPTGALYEDVFEREGTDIKVPISIYKIDQYYFDAMGFQIVAGRQFDINRQSDSEGVIPNETSIRMLGWTPEEAIGHKIFYPGGDGSRHEIIGVVKDFHLTSLRQAIGPMMFSPLQSSIWGTMRVLMVRFTTDDVPGLMSRIERKWNETVSDTPIVMTFMEDDLNRQYLQEQRLGGLFGIFSGLSILIAVIGMVGLVAYSAEVRKKEIGIRKVFGATTTRILVMMNEQYIKLIAIGLLVAVPGSWWLANRWLDAFEYQTEVGPMIFIVAGLAQVALALLSVAYLSLRAASSNPAAVLKEE
jgi:putative ABC transport system permease protein